MEEVNVAKGETIILQVAPAVAATAAAEPTRSSSCTKNAISPQPLHPSHHYSTPSLLQGEEGQHFYLVDSGTLDCFVKSNDPAHLVRGLGLGLGLGLANPNNNPNPNFNPNPNPKHDSQQKAGSSEDSCLGARVLEYTAGSTFGELALMYNAPRAASVVATSDASLWAMERETFSNIVMQTMSQKRAHLQGLLGAVPLLQGLDTYERHALADLFEEKTFKAGEGRVGVSVGVGVGIRVVRVTG